MGPMVLEINIIGPTLIFISPMPCKTKYTIYELYYLKHKTLEELLPRSSYETKYGRCETLEVFSEKFWKDVSQEGYGCL